MKHFVLFSAALATLPLAAAAQSPKGYSATPVTTPVVASVITRGSLWKCGGGSCFAAKPSGSHLTMCQLAAQRLGTLSAFTANGTAFAPEQLEKCNARAKG